MTAGELPEGWDADIPTFTTGRQAARDARGRRQGHQRDRGAAAGAHRRLGRPHPSTDTALKGAGDFQTRPSRSPTARARSAATGLRRPQPPLRRARARHGRDRSTAWRCHGGLIPFCATFLIFSDYMRPSIRLAALMKLHVDLRLHPRQHRRGRGRADAPAGRAGRVAARDPEPDRDPARPTPTRRRAPGAWRSTQRRAGGAAADAAGAAGAARARERRRAAAATCSPTADGAPDVILIATGSEVARGGRGARRCWPGAASRRGSSSLPSWELFEAQPQAYRDSVLPPSVLARVAVEAGVPQGWDRYVGPFGAVRRPSTAASAPRRRSRS